MEMLKEMHTEERKAKWMGGGEKEGFGVGKEGLYPESVARLQR